MRYQEWKTVCLGKYLVDMPTGVNLEFNNSFSYNAGKYPLKEVQGTAEDAKRMAEAKANELKASPHDTKGSLYVRSIPLANGGVLVQGFCFPSSVDYYYVYLYIPVVTRGKSFVYTYQGDAYPDSEQQDLQQFSAFAASFRPLDEGVIPKEPGICIGDVILINPPGSFVGDLSVGFSDPHATQLTMAFVVSPAFNKPEWITQIDGWDYVHCTNLGGNGKCERLRSGKHPAGSIQGEEICLIGKTKNNKYRTYDFQWENPGSETIPHLTFSLWYPGPSEDSPEPLPFFNDDEALAVWDKFVNSLRLRPTA